MSKKRVIKDLDLAEISFVDRPAQEGALSRIIKSKDGGIAQTIAKRWIDPSEGAVNFAEAFEQEARHRNYWEAQEKLHPAIDALNTAVRSIVGDQGLGAEDKRARVTESVMGFMETLRDLLPDVQDELMEAVEKASNSAGDHPSEEELSMSDESQEVAKLREELADLQKQVEATQAERDEALAKAEMSDEEKAFMKEMDAEERKAFMEAKPEDRKRRMAKAAEAEETVEIDGQVIAKSKVGDDAFAVFKAQAQRMEAIEKQAREDREQAELARLEKRASDEFAHVPGSPENLAKALRAVEAIEDEDVRKTLETVISTAEKLAQAGFDSKGHSDGNVSKSKQDFDAKVAEIAKAQDLPRHEALSKARREHPDLYEAAYGATG